MIIEDGQPVEASLKLELLPWDEVLESARQNGIDDISNVHLAILETSGNISFLTKE